MSVSSRQVIWPVRGFRAVPNTSLYCMPHLYLKYIDICATLCNSLFSIMTVFAYSEHHISFCGNLNKFSDCLQGEQEFRLDPMLEEHEAVMEKMNTWNFQIFDLVDRTGGKTGRILSYVSTTTTKKSSRLAVVVFVLTGCSIRYR